MWTLGSQYCMINKKMLKLRLIRNWHQTIVDQENIAFCCRDNKYEVFKTREKKNRLRSNSKDQSVKKDQNIHFVLTVFESYLM